MLDNFMKIHLPFFPVECKRKQKTTELYIPLTRQGPAGSDK